MVNIYKLRLTILQQEIVRLLFVHAGEVLNQWRIAQSLNVTPPAVMKALPLLEKEGLITSKKDKASQRWAVQLNRSNPAVMQLKRADNLRQIYESGLAYFLEEEFAGGTVILFGSYSRGEDLINSDIDIAIIGRKNKSLDLEAYEKALGRIIHINFYDSFKKIHKHLKENLCNRIVLIGGVEL